MKNTKTAFGTTLKKMFREKLATFTGLAPAFVFFTPHFLLDRTMSHYSDFLKGKNAIWLAFASVVLFLCVSFPTALMADTIPTIHSVATGGSWSSASTWVEGRVPNADDVVEINGDVVVSSSVTIGGMLVAIDATLRNNQRHTTTTVNGNLVNNGTIEDDTSGYYFHLKVNGDVTNNGTIQNINSNNMRLFVSGNIVNAGTWTPYRTDLTGTEARSITGNLLSGEVYFADNFELLSDLKAQNLYFNGKTITLNRDDIVFTVPGTVNLNGTVEGTEHLNLASSQFTGGTVTVPNIHIDSETVTLSGMTFNGVPHFKPSSSVVIANSTFNTPIEFPPASVSVSIRDSITFNQGLTVPSDATLRNNQRHTTITVNGNLVNNGTIEDDTSGYYFNLAINGDITNNGTIQNISSDDMRVSVSGNIVNTGTWTPYRTDLTGTEARSITGNLLSGEVYFADNFELLSDLKAQNLYFNGKTITLNRDDIVFTVPGTVNLNGTVEGTEHLNLASSQFTGGTVTVPNIHIDSETVTLSGMTFNGVPHFKPSSSVVIANSTFNTPIEFPPASVSVSIRDSITFNQGLTVPSDATLRNNQRHTTITVNGNLVNNGTIEDDTSGYYFNLAINGDITNNGTIQNISSDDMRVFVSGNIVNTGTWTPYRTDLTGTGDRSVTGNLLGGDVYFADNFELLSNLNAQNLYFNGKTITLNRDDIVFTVSGTVNPNGVIEGTEHLNFAGTNFTMTDSTVSIPNIHIDSDAVSINRMTFNGVPHLKLSSSVVITDSTFNIPMEFPASVNVSFRGSITFNDGFTVPSDATVRNNRSYTTITVNGNLVNNGTIEDDTSGGDFHLRVNGNVANNGTIQHINDYDMRVSVSGNIVNNGTWTPYRTNLTGTEARSVTGNLLGGDVYFADNFELLGNLSVQNLYFNNKTITLNRDDIIFNVSGTVNPNGVIEGTEHLNFAGTNFTMTDSTVSIPNIHIDSDAVSINRMTFNGVPHLKLSSSVVITDSTFNIPMEFPASVNVSFRGSITFNDDLTVPSDAIIRNNQYYTTITVNGNLVNNGTIEDDTSGYYFDLRVNGDVTNNGIIQNTNSDDMQVSVSGNIVNDGTWTPYRTNLTGTEARSITGNLLGGDVYFADHFELLSNLNTQNLYFNGKTITLNRDDIVFTVSGTVNPNGVVEGTEHLNFAGTTITMSRGTVNAPNVHFDSDTVSISSVIFNGIPHLKPASTVVIADSTFNIPMAFPASVNVSFRGYTTFNDGFTIPSDATVRNNQSYTTITVNGNLVNNGTIEDDTSSGDFHLTVNGNVTNNGMIQHINAYDMQVYVSGNIVNTGTWTPYATNLTYNLPDTTTYQIRFSPDGRIWEDPIDTGASFNATSRIPDSWYWQVRDLAGGNWSESHGINIRNSFTADQTSGEPSLSVQFTYTPFIDNIITSWAWDFDNDGIIDSKAENPSHTYNANGLYSVTLTTGDGSSEFTTTQTDFILVHSPVSFDAPAQNSFTQAAESHYYKIEFEPGSNIRFILDDLDNTGNTEIYVKRGSFPSRDNYDYQSTGGTDQVIDILLAEAGNWYVLAYGADASGSYKLTTHSLNVGIDEIQPTFHGHASSVPLTITGAGFDDGTSTFLVAEDGTEYTPTSVSIDSLTQITATFDITVLAIGKYDVKVASAVGEDVLPKAFEVIEGSEAKLETNLILPRSFGRNTIATIYVEYENSGSIAMPAPLLVLRSADEDDSDKPLLTLDYKNVVRNLWAATKSNSAGHTVQFLADGDDDTPGVLYPGDKGRVPVYYSGLLPPWDGSDRNVEFEVRVIEADSDAPFDWTANKAVLKPDTISAEAWETLFSNLVSSLGTTWGDYVSTLAQNAVYLKQHGNQRVHDLQKLFQFELMQAMGISPLVFLAEEADILVDAPGIPLGFGRYFAGSLTSRHQDGPLGKGWVHAWQSRIDEDAQGNAIITVLGVRRLYQPDSRGGYFSPQGEHSKLTKSAGIFTLVSAEGTTQKFRADGWLDYIEDLNGNRITADYSGGLLTRLVHNAGPFLSLAYEGSRISAISDHTGELNVAFTYTDGQLTGVTDVLGKYTSYAYHACAPMIRLPIAPAIDENGQPMSEQPVFIQTCPEQYALKTIHYSDNTREDFGYDGQGRIASLSYNNVLQSSLSYDAFGAVTVTAKTDQSTEKFFYGAGGELIKYRSPLGHISQSEFNRDYQVTKFIRADGLAAQFEYDRKGNLKRGTDVLEQTTRFKYGAFKRLIGVTDAKQHLLEYGYDIKGNPIRLGRLDGNFESYQPDAQGNIIQSSKRRGTPIDYSYYPNGLLKSKTYADGRSVAYTYTAVGNIASVTDATGTTSMSYYPNHQLKRISYPLDRFLEFTYDAAGRRASRLDQSGYALHYSYNSLGLLESIAESQDGGTQLVRYSYDAKQRLSRKVLANGVSTEYQYDVEDNLKVLTNRAADNSVLSRFKYTYDALGRRKTMSTLDGDWEYDYDATGQLRGASFTSRNPAIANKTISYQYDAVGNRIQETVDSVSTAYTTNDLNQYEQVGTTTYDYDTDGNLITKTQGANVWEYRYNDDNKLVAVSGPDGISEYHYDGLGNRIATTHNGETTYYQLDPAGFGNVIGEYDEAGNLTARYNHGFGLLSRDEHFYTFDGNGNTVGLTDSDSHKVNSYVYEPFGGTLHKTETVDNDFEFVGQFGVMQENNGLLFMRNRFYAPSLGRFVSEDPIGLAGEDVNLYRYVANEPVSWADPEGYAADWTVRTDFDIPTGHIHVEDGNNKFRFNANGDLIEHDGSKLKDKKLAKINKTAAKKAWKYAKNKKSKAIKRMLGILAASAAPALAKANPFVGAAFTGNDIGSFINEVWPNNPIAQAAEAISVRVWGRLYGLPPNWWEDHPKYGGNSAPIWVARDPNELTGPKGYGEANYLPADTLLAYRIDFENDATATAPAQRVDITNQLPDTLDWNSFQFTEIGFGDELIAVPQDSGQSFETTVPMVYQDVEFEVKVQANIDASTGMVSIRFYSLQPDSELPPPVDIGFLPPENGTGRGMGYFAYTVNPKPALAENTEIRNIAKIVFDLGEVIYTNQVDPHDPSQGTDPTKEALVTIDVSAPNSAVDSLLESSNSSFTVSWNGTDNASGIATYDIYVRDSINHEWQLWQAQTAETNAEFHGEPGRRYEFYSIATDNVGHEEQKQPLVEASTIVGNYTAYGTISDKLGNPIAGVVVTVGGREFTTDKNGYWEATGLFAGEHEITATKDGYNFLRQSCVVGDGENCNLSFVNMDVAEATPASCQLYVVHDGGLNNSQFLTVSLDGLFEVNQLGPMYPGYDIEALAIHPSTDIIYAASGNNTADGFANGYFYVVDGENGELFPIGSTSFEEIGDLAFGSDGKLWAWAKGEGLITIEPTTGIGTLVIPYDILVEGLTLNKDLGTVFYGAVNTDLWMYNMDIDTLEVACTDLVGETEALEMMADGLLLIGVHKDKTLSLHAFDPNACTVVAGKDIPMGKYDDIEGIALPINACLP
jgi:RHS repeat-associated protein